MTKPTKTKTVTIQEINFDAWETDNILVSGGHDWHSGTTDTITITTDTPLSSFGTDVITVTQDDLRELKTSSNGINQGDCQQHEGYDQRGTSKNFW